MKTPRKILSLFLSVIAAVCLIAVCFLLIKKTMDDKANEKTLDALRNSAQAVNRESSGSSSAAEAEDAEALSQDNVKDTENAGAGQPGGSVPSVTKAAGTDGTSGDSTSEPESPAIPNPYKDSFLANEDMAAWIQIPGTNIDYPVMWTPRDENYYLYRGFDGRDNQNGCLILDTDSSLDPLTTNLIIHGHNMRSGAMFGNLTDYEKESYFREHREITLYTKDVQRNYEVIAVFRSQVYKKSEKVFKFYKFFQGDTQEQFDDFYQNIKKLSLYDTGVTAEFGDHFITLSTCVYHVEQGRFVVVAKEVENGDVYLPIEE